MPKKAVTDEEINKCFSVISELRPHLVQETFLPLVRKMEKEGYILAYIKDNSKVVSVAGYRITTNLFMGKNLYIDDLITTKNARSKGHGESMVMWLCSIAIENECTHLHLDSGVQREQAHKFYFKRGLVISSYHFGKKLG